MPVGDDITVIISGTEDSRTSVSEIAHPCFEMSESKTCLYPLGKELE